MTTATSNDWKRRVQKRFDRHAKQYADSNHLQRRVADRLMGFLPNRPFLRILEIGCGDGAMTALLAARYPDSEIIASDISPQMIDLASKRLEQQAHVSFTVMDGENIAAGQPYDLIISNMTTQWFLDLPVTLQAWQSHLTAEGMIFTSRPGNQCFPEWRQALKAENLRDGLLSMNATSYHFDEEFIAVDCPDTLTFLRDLRRSGVTTGRDNHTPLSPRELKQACRRCDETSDGVMTWHIVYESLTSI